MCGIVGVIGSNQAAPLILDALKRLEYRGYDSAGVATVDGGGALHRTRASGKLRNLEMRLDASPLAGTTGVGHTRWATHGAPTEANAHPHRAGRVAVVHNGIIENFRALRARVEAAGGTMVSDTDTETVAHLLDQKLASGATLEEALVSTISDLEGAYALAIAFEDHPGVLAAARRGSPLAIGTGTDITMIGSDALALAPFCERIIYLDEGDIAVLRGASITILDAEGTPVDRPEQPIPMQISLAEKGNYRHFMLKEIHEQSDVIARNLGHYLDMADRAVRASAVPVDFTRFNRMSMSACGTAFYAALVARYWFEAVAGIAVDLDVASELRYRHRPAAPDELALFVSQSGETADTLASLRAAKAQGQTVAAVVNVETSTMAREADVKLPILAGTEVGVASTKAFTCQLTTLAVMAIKAGLDRGRLSIEDAGELVDALAQLPGAVADALNLEDAVAEVAKDVAPVQTALFVGRGASFALAMEGALKLKEISYIHAEGYAAGELKHGPIALVDEDVPVIVVMPSDPLFSKTMSNMQEVAARGGRIIAVTDDAGGAEVADTVATTLVMPRTHDFIAPIVYSVPLQLLAYHAAVINGTDVDQPRNLAKSVTVE